VSSPSMHESHDEPDFGQLTTPDREFIAQVFRGLDERLRLVEQRLGSNPPGSAEVTSPTGWRVRAPAWVAIALAVVVTIALAIWEADTLQALLKR
jgi:hypothetical protein